MAKKVVIRKYENRRLYDTTNSRYVNLDEVAQMVRNGVEIEVVEAASGEDITRLVMTQIIVEQAKEPNSVFPLDVLRQMIAASGRIGQETALKYMRAMFDAYQNAYRVFPAVAPFDFMGAMRPADRPGTEPPRPAPEHHPPGPATNGDADDVAALKRRVEELESLITKVAAAPPKRTRKRQSRKRL